MIERLSIAELLDKLQHAQFEVRRAQDDVRSCQYAIKEILIEERAYDCLTVNMPRLRRQLQNGGL